MLYVTDPSQPPSRTLLLLELRAIWELGAFFTTYPLLRLAPKGDGHPVLAQPEGGWQPFDRSGVKALVFRDPRRDTAGAAASAHRAGPVPS